MSIALNTLQNLLTPVLNITISALVVRIASRELWGEFVGWLITAQLLAHILAWGNKEYLLRQFSQHPHHMTDMWWSAFIVRFLLYLVICPVLLVLDGGWLLVIWIAPLVIAQSHDVLVIFRRHFAFAVLTDTLLTIGMLVMLIAGGDITQGRLFAVFIIGAWGKALVYAMRYHHMHTIWFYLKTSVRSHSLMNFAYFRHALPFFLLGLSGMLASRIDLYTLSAIAPKGDVAMYQVAINLLLYVQAGANFILIPFVKTLYRLDKPTIDKITIRLFVFGCLIMPVAVMGIALVIGWIYDLHYPSRFWVMAGLFALPIFGYLPIIHRLYGQNAQNHVLWVNIIGAGCNGVLNLMLIPPLGITGALTASAMCQWAMLLAYIWRNL
jgi:O-antigen/teichoic acid export membrane protein